VTLRREEHISSYFEPSAWNTLLAGIGPADVHSRAPRQIPLVAAGAETLGDGVLAQSDAGNVVFCQLEPWQYSTNLANLKRTFRRSSYLVTRLLANLGVAGDTPLLERFHRPVTTSAEPRWLTGFYLDQPAEWDDPYRFFRW
jgi:hypothetical protein